MTCTAMTVFLDHAPTQADHAPAQGAKQTTDAQSGPAANSGVKRLEAKGPVTVISKSQVATGDNGSYDKAEDKVWLIGHVTLSDGQNVTKGDKLTYDLKNGEATVDTSTKSSRVHGQFIPKSNADAAKAGRRRGEGEIGAGHCRSSTGLLVRSQSAGANERRHAARARKRASSLAQMAARRERGIGRRLMGRPWRAGRSRRLSARQGLSRRAWSCGREPVRAARRGGRASRPERRRQDDRLLYDYRARHARQGR